MNAGVRPALFPVIQVGLGFLQSFEALSLQRRFLGMTNTGFDLPLAVRIVHTASQCGRTVMRQHVTIERIERGIVDVGFEYALAQVVEDDQTRHATQPAKSFLMQFRPNPGTGTAYEQTHGFTAITQRQDKQTGAAIFSAAGVTHHGPRSVIHLGFFARSCLDHRAGFRRRLAAELPDESLHALIATGEAAGIDQVLPDALGVAAFGEFQLDGFPVRLARTAAGGCVCCGRRL